MAKQRTFGLPGHLLILELFPQISPRGILISIVPHLLFLCKCLQFSRWRYWRTVTPLVNGRRKEEEKDRDVWFSKTAQDSRLQDDAYERLWKTSSPKNWLKMCFLEEQMMLFSNLLSESPTPEQTKTWARFTWSKVCWLCNNRKLQKNPSTYRWRLDHKGLLAGGPTTKLNSNHVRLLE